MSKAESKIYNIKDIAEHLKYCLEQQRNGQVFFTIDESGNLGICSDGKDFESYIIKDDFTSFKM